MIPVDILTVLAPGGKIRDPVLQALRNQGMVTLQHYIVEGPGPAPGEPRGKAITRGRNRAKQLGTAHYAMFLDSDVVLPPLAIEKLVYGLLFNRRHAALGINYQGDVHGPWAQHVAMGALLFIRPILDLIQFRTEPRICECYCCCVDIRRLGYHIDYLPALRAQHLKATLLP